MPIIIARRGLVGLGAGLVPAGFAWLAPLRQALAGGGATAREARLAAAAGGGARLVLTLGGGAAQPWRVTAQVAPPALLLHLPGIAWRAPRRLAGAGPVREARWRDGGGGGARLELLLERTVALRRAALQGGRLVLDLAPGPVAEFARLATPPGRVLAAGGGRGAAAPRGPLPLVVLDPGHGGRDPGATGTAGTLEKRITLAAALDLKRRLEAAGRCRVALTRTRDVFVPLADRVEFARRRGAALFVSLHADSAPGARGASVYTLAETASDPLSAALAQRENRADRAGGLRLPSVPPEVQRILLSLVRQETRAGSARLARLAVHELGEEVALLPNTHRQAGFVVLKAPEVPSMLVELGFLSHPADEAALRRPDHRRRLAAALGRAVEGWLANQTRQFAGLPDGED